MAVKYIKEYHSLGRVDVCPNSEKFHEDLESSLSIKTAVLPNYYPLGDAPSYSLKDRHEIDIGCFGAIRPLKNQLIQAMSAMGYAEKECKLLRFHINAGRVERGQEELKNMRALFEGTKHELVEHGWLSHADFLVLVRKMDVGMQVSFSESFNIVAADFVGCNVPLVGSPDIEWLHPLFTSDPNSSSEIRHAIGRVLFLSKMGMQRLNRARLHEYDRDSEKAWLKYLDYP